MTESKKSSKPLRGELWLLVVFLGAGLIHGLLYVFIVPPWQHYDEPTHFEVVWLTAKLGRHPTAEDYDPQLSRDVTQSMMDNGFYSGMSGLPDLSSDVQVHIFGYPQFEEQPLYYFLASLPLKFLHSAEIETQLYAARLVSVLLYLLCIFAAWETARTIMPPGHPLRWMLPAFVLLLPGFTDLMTAVNNDVLAVTAFSFFFWGSARLLKSGYTVFNISWVVLSLALIYFAKNTAYEAFLLLPLVLIVAVIPKRYRWIAWSSALAIGTLGLVLALKFDDPASWHRSTAQMAPIRQKTPLAVLGEYALALDLWENTNPPWVPPSYTLLPLETSLNLKDREMTLGFWIWSNRDIKVNSPILGTPLMEAVENIQVSQLPQFHAIQIKMPATTLRVWVKLTPSPEDRASTSVYYDGFVLADGYRPLGEEPQFTSPDGSEGTWGGKPFTNYLRNGSFEDSWPRVEPHLDNLIARILPDKTRPTLILNSILDWPATQIMFRQTYQHMMQTFWARFGWGHVPLIWPGLYKVLNWIWIVGFVGAIAGVIRRGRRSPWDWAWLTLLSALLIWFANFVRGVGYFTSNNLYIPPARYAFPAIIPTLMIICLGWLEIYRFIQSVVSERKRTRAVKTSQPVQEGKNSLEVLATGAFLGFLIFLAILSLFSVLSFYYRIG